MTDRKQAHLEVVSDSDRPLIRIDPGRIHVAADQVETVLAEQEIFRRDQTIVEVVHGDGLVDHPVRDITGPAVRALEIARFIDLANQYSEFEKYDSRKQKYVRVDCPRAIPEIIMARPNPKFRPLHGITEVPVLRSDGSCFDQVGYDDETGIYVAAIPAGWIAPKHSPSKRDAERAAERLREVFKTFPFALPEDESAAFLAVITATIRQILPSAPLFGISSPVAGTGKTLLADVIAVIATGRRAPVMALGDDNAELEKRIGSVLLSGDRIVVIDNIERPVKSDFLCQVATQPVVQIRVLGVSKRALLPTATIFVLTGNNLTLRGDLVRRVVPCKLDAGEERPEQRTFTRDALDGLEECRAEIIADALTITRAYLANDAPDVGITPAGSFGEWDRLARRPLCWAGLPDPLIAASRLRDNDPDLEALQAVLTAWADCFDTVPVRAAEVVQAANERTQQFSGSPGEYVHADLHAALELITTRAEKTISTRSLGYWLRTHQDRPLDGLLIHRAEDDRAGVRWQLVRN